MVGKLTAAEAGLPPVHRSVAPESCLTCRFWLTEQPARHGVCRRKAPIPNMRLPETSFWPPTKPTDWCGDYERS